MLGSSIVSLPANVKDAGIIPTIGKKFYKKDNLSEEVIVGPTESMSKSKKNTLYSYIQNQKKI